ncbi:dihydrofolate reductase family protein [Mucilaginibacter sp. SP1R1]|uniref:dihydrofolate reductase family protein n=1 Tax=Mucilaginibacter sp. SP1R1 TaxID=2723091 RepID=UPI00161FA7DF|nr:dihydrofolate reductase family protein [Mucilaginibacter sp. SP1R1]MBB6150324.1 dihydrofolate reductase [Mucilaginibacter sp. SP1R1]
MNTGAFKLTIHMVSSLDGFIAKTDNSISWFETVDYYEQGITLTEQDTAAFLKSIDCYVMGYRTYEHALKLSESYGWVYGDVPVIVITHRNLPVNPQNVEFYSGDLNTLVDERLKSNYKNVWMAGGATLAKELILLKLADDIRLSIMPIILGEGKLFFDQIGQEQALHLKNVTAYKNGIVDLHYEIKHSKTDLIH